MARKPVKKKVVRKSIVPAPIVNYLKHDVCNEGVIHLTTFLTKVESEKAVKAVLAVLKPRMAAAQKEAAENLEGYIRQLKQTAEYIEADCGKELKFQIV